MKIFENPQMAKFVMRKIQDKLANDRSGDPWHASELFGCPRKAILGREIKRSFSERDLLYFIRGYAIQEYIFGVEEDGITIGGVVYSPDCVDGDNIIEMKTTNFWYHKKTQDEFHPNKVEGGFTFSPEAMSDWIKRTKAYCAVLGKSTGHIVLYFMNGKDGPELHTWTLEFTPEELDEIIVEISARKLLLDNFWTIRADSDDWTDLPPVTLRTYAKECDFCPMKAKCLPELTAKGMI